MSLLPLVSLSVFHHSANHAGHFPVFARPWKNAYICVPFVSGLAVQYFLKCSKTSSSGSPRPQCSAKSLKAAS
jgi:hypothetical protein